MSATNLKLQTKEYDVVATKLFEIVQGEFHKTRLTPDFMLSLYGYKKLSDLDSIIAVQYDVEEQRYIMRKFLSMLIQYPDRKDFIN